MNAPCLTTARLRIAQALLALSGVGSFVFQPLQACAQTHSHHAVEAGVKRSETVYDLPDVWVTTAEGQRRRLSSVINDGRPVMLNFIYTSCNAVCPVTSQVFTEVRERLGRERERVNMVSISIDPEQDTPAKLRDYAQRFGGAGAWSYVSTTVTDAIAIQRAMGAWWGDKMNHQPVSFIRPAKSATWVRLQGFAGPSLLLDEVNKALAADRRS